PVAQVRRAVALNRRPVAARQRLDRLDVACDRLPQKLLIRRLWRRRLGHASIATAAERRVKGFDASCWTGPLVRGPVAGAGINTDRWCENPFSHPLTRESFLARHRWCENQHRPLVRESLLAPPHARILSRAPPRASRAHRAKSNAYRRALYGRHGERALLGAEGGHRLAFAAFAASG